MTLPASTKNAMLDGVTLDQASLHSAFPGTTGANEISGGSYARQTIVVNASSGGIRALNASVAFSVPASTVRWVGFWDSTTFRGCAPNGGAVPKNFMALASNDTVYCAAHGYSDGQKVVFYQGTPPGGLTEGTVYFVRDAATDSFKVTASLAGVAIDLTSAASFGCVVCAITEDTYASSGTHTLSTASVAIPD